LLDQGIYPVTLARDVLGQPSHLTAVGVRENGVDVTQYMTLEYADGRHAQLASSMVEFIDPTASVSGTEGWVHIPFPFWAATEFTSHTSDPDSFLRTQQHPYEREGKGYIPMLHAVNTAIFCGDLEHPRHRWDDTVDVLRTLHDIRTQLTPADVR
jgi:predicted dehydrogenase